MALTSTAISSARRAIISTPTSAIDDFTALATDPDQHKLALQVISERRDGRRSATTSGPFKDWTKIFPDALNAQIITERRDLRP